MLPFQPEPGEVSHDTEWQNRTSFTVSPEESNPSTKEIMVYTYIDDQMAKTGHDEPALVVNGANAEEKEEDILMTSSSPVTLGPQYILKISKLS